MFNLKFFSGLLLVQIALICFIFCGSDKTLVLSEPLFNFNAAEVSKIDIKTPNGQTGLQKKNDKWVLVNFDNFPVSQAKVDTALKSFLELKTQPPIAETKQAAKQLKVEDNNYEKIITIEQNGKTVANLITGASPSFRRVYGRKAGTTEIYELGLNTFEFAVTYQDWFQRDALKLDDEKVIEVKLPALDLRKEGDKYFSAALEVDKNKAKALISKLSGIYFTDVLNPGSDEEFKKLVEVARFEVKTDTLTRSAEVRGPIDTDFYLVKFSDFPYVFKISKSALQFVKDSKLEDLKASEPQAIASNS